jgi:hypothetical protein
MVVREKVTWVGSFGPFCVDGPGNQETGNRETGNRETGQPGNGQIGQLPKKANPVFAFSAFPDFFLHFLASLQHERGFG